MKLQPADNAYKLAVRTAAVAGVFSLIVCALLLFEYSRRPAKDPGESPALMDLREEINTQPDNEKLRKVYRSLDQQLRQEYFFQRAFTTAGAWLLLGGASVFLISASWAATLRRKLPKPEPRTTQIDREEATTQVGRWAVAGLSLLLVATVVTLSITMSKTLPPAGPPLPESPADAKELAKAWPRFRGPGGLGISAFADLPTSWDGESGKNILWKTVVPLPGKNSPVVCRGRVFLSGADEKRRKVFCFDAEDGKLLWQREVPGTPQSMRTPLEIEFAGFAAPTTVTDGYRVFAIFANGDIAALDYAGKVVWSRSLGIPDNDYGHASSLTMFENRVLVQFDQGTKKDDKSKFLALDADTGKTVWEMPRAVPASWTSPIVVESAGRKQVISATSPWVFSYDPVDGTELWRAKCLSQDVGPSPTFRTGTVYVANAYPCLSAIGADGSGDVTETHVKWTGEDGMPDTACPLVTDKYVLLLASYGVLTCYSTNDGKMLWEEDFDTQFASSPSLVGDRVYIFGEEGDAWVVEPGDEGCKRISEAKLGEDCVTSPAFQKGRIYIRGKKHLFCIGQ